jgi:S-DNA-T family DNA segregation ATPase FtsK/SpoIIIE
MIRVQSCYVTDEDIENIIKYVSSQQSPQYENMSLVQEEIVTRTVYMKASDDPLYSEMLEYAVRAGSVSASKLQRQFGVGFNRASKIIDEFEEAGIVGPQKGSKPREVLIKMEGVTPDSEE